MIAQFRAYADLHSGYASAQARLGQLDSVAARRAYADQCITQGEDLAAECVDPQIVASWGLQRDRIHGDVTHWEDSIRTTIRAWSGREASQAFDAGADGRPDVITPRLASEATRAYIERRISRLAEWKATL